MKLREEGKSGESGGISKPTFGELYGRNCTGDDCYMAEDRGRIGVEMVRRILEGGKSVKGNPFGPAFCPVARKDSMFSLKGRFSEDISSGAGDSVSRAIFHSGRAPTQRADVADHFIKLLYYSSGPCGGPPVLPFSRPFFTATYVDEGLALSRVYGPSTRFSLSLFLFIAVKKLAGGKRSRGGDAGTPIGFFHVFLSLKPKRRSESISRLACNTENSKFVFISRDILIVNVLCEKMIDVVSKMVVSKLHKMIF